MKEVTRIAVNSFFNLPSRTCVYVKITPSSVRPFAVGPFSRRQILSVYFSVLPYQAVRPRVQDMLSESMRHVLGVLREIAKLNASAEVLGVCRTDHRLQRLYLFFCVRACLLAPTKCTMYEIPVCSRAGVAVLNACVKGRTHRARACGVYLRKRKRASFGNP